MALKFRRGTTAQQSGSLAFGEPYVNTSLNTLIVGGASGDIVLSTSGTGSTGNFGAISGSGLDITGNANIAGNVTVGGQLTIGDATADTVNVVASLSSSLIPQTTNAFDLGSATKIWRDLYISSGSIKMYDGGGQLVSTITATSLNSNTASIEQLNSFTSSQLSQNSTLATYTSSINTRMVEVGVVTGSLISSASVDASRFSTIGTYTGSVDTRFSTLATYTGSVNTRLTEVGVVTASLISSASNNEQRIAANEAVSSSYVRNNSTNTFNGNQTISGSLIVTQDLTILGSSSIQNISSSTLDIGTNLIKVNVNQPAVRFGGLAVVDSGSAGASGSFLYDAVEDEFIFVHKGNGTNVTSSHFLLGPETYDNLGNETYLTNNRLPKGTGKEHIVDSTIIDDGTTVSINNNLDVTGSIKATQLSTIGTYTGSVNTRLTEIGVVTSSLISSASVDQTRFTTLGTYTASVDTRFTTLGTLTGSYDTRWSTLGTYTGSVNTRLTEIGVVTSSLISSASVDQTRFTTLGTYTGSVDTRFSTLATLTGSYDTRWSTLATTTGSLIVDTNNLETFTASLSTTSNVRFGSLGIGMNASGTSGRIDAANDVVAFSSSDRNLKENIKPIPNAIEKLRKISGNTFDWKADLKDVHGYEGNDVGVIAQEIEEVLPQIVTTRDNGYKAVKYEKLAALLIEAIKEQQQHIDNLTIQVEELKKQKGL